jgi:hypothetical protein
MAVDSIRNGARIAHDAGLATWLGGSVFGKVALNRAVAHVGSRPERGQVVNAAWGAFNVVNAAAVTAVVGGWMASRGTETLPVNLSERERSLATAKDGLVATVALLSLATGIEGVRLARQAPDGAVPIESGTRPAPETPPAAVGIQRRIGLLADLNILAGYALVGVNAALAQENFSRPPLRRGLLRRSR